MLKRLRVSHSKRPTGERVIIEDSGQWQTGYVSLDADDVPQLVEELWEQYRETRRHDVVAELRKDLKCT